eukprot:TRINITY_DN1314_c4_g1_i2.p1 TRINITY_DN1314_c4_g1~~TRINITY_DN1314_c4_g1_i2.p1  ORF type:complete len:576 (+),score=114.86 TRINITY_DN1314_c4_g1_i2:29-1756(+)
MLRPGTPSYSPPPLDEEDTPERPRSCPTVYSSSVEKAGYVTPPDSNLVNVVIPPPMVDHHHHHHHHHHHPHAHHPPPHHVLPYMSYPPFCDPLFGWVPPGYPVPPVDIGDSPQLHPQYPDDVHQPAYGPSPDVGLASFLSAMSHLTLVECNERSNTEMEYFSFLLSVSSQLQKHLHAEQSFNNTIRTLLSTERSNRERINHFGKTSTVYLQFDELNSRSRLESQAFAASIKLNAVLREQLCQDVKMEYKRARQNLQDETRRNNDSLRTLVAAEGLLMDSKLVSALDLEEASARSEILFESQWAYQDFSQKEGRLARQHLVASESEILDLRNKISATERMRQECLTMVQLCPPEDFLSLQHQANEAAEVKRQLTNTISLLSAAKDEADEANTKAQDTINTMIQEQAQLKATIRTHDSTVETLRKEFQTRIEETQQELKEAAHRIVILEGELRETERVNSYNSAEYQELKKKKRQWQNSERLLEQEQAETRRLKDEVRKSSNENKESHERMRIAEDQVVRFVERQMELVSKSAAAAILSDFEQASRLLITRDFDNTYSDLSQLHQSLSTVLKNFQKL